jgi:hypothetical protein
MSKKQKTARDMKQPLTQDFYSVDESLIEDVPLTPLIVEELATLAKCYRKKNPANRAKLWTEFRQSQTVETPEPDTEEPPGEESRAKEAAEIGPLGRFIHYPLTPVRPKIEGNLNQKFVAWIRAIPSPDLETADPFHFVPGILRSSFDVMRLELDSRVNTEVRDLEWTGVFKTHGFTRLPVFIEHPLWEFPCFKSPRFYVVLAQDPLRIFLNYFVHPS